MVAPVGGAAGCCGRECIGKGGKEDDRRRFNLWEQGNLGQCNRLRARVAMNLFSLQRNVGYRI